MIKFNTCIVNRLVISLVRMYQRLPKNIYFSWFKREPTNKWTCTTLKKKKKKKRIWIVCLIASSRSIAEFQIAVAKGQRVASVYYYEAKSPIYWLDPRRLRRARATTALIKFTFVKGPIHRFPVHIRLQRFTLLLSPICIHPSSLSSLRGSPRSWIIRFIAVDHLPCELFSEI